MPDINSFFSQFFNQVRTPFRPGSAGPGPINEGLPLNSPSLPQTPLLSNLLGTREGRLSLNALFGNDSLLLNPLEISTFLKDVLKLPEELRLFLLDLALESTPQTEKPKTYPNLKQLIESDLSDLAVPLEEVQKLLKDNSKEALDKLFKLLQGNQMGHTKSSQQVADLMVTLTKLTEKIQASPREATETLMLLYIPWYPLAPAQKLQVDFDTQAHEEGGGGEADISVVLFLETTTLGRFKVVVGQIESLQVVVKVFHEKLAETFAPTIQEFTDALLSQDGLPAALFHSELMKAPQQETPNPVDTTPRPEKDTDFKGATRQESTQQLHIDKGQSVTVLVLNTAYAIARYIFEADERNRPLQKPAPSKP